MSAEGSIRSVPDAHDHRPESTAVDPEPIAIRWSSEPSGERSPSQLLRSPFPSIDDYAFLSDREVNALVASSGNVEWMCLPRPDAPSVFGSMLDRAAGRFRLGPDDVMVPAGRRYLPGTMVVETTWRTASGWAIVRDALLIGPWHRKDRIEGYRRPPAEHEAEQCLLRTIRCVNGTVELEMSCEPVFDYGRAEARWEYEGTGYGAAIARGPEGAPELRLTTSFRLGLEGRGAYASARLREGETAFVALSWGDEVTAPTTWDEAADRMWQTGDYWRGWLQHGKFPDHPWKSYLERSALTLKGLTYAPTGAMLAAATKSLPETPGGERNWDYRFSWVRDATFALWGLYALGFDHEANDFFHFIAEAASEDEGLQPMYAVGGERDLKESELEHLAGYRGARPVRTGNAAYAQDQHDVWGSLLDSVYLHTRSRDHLPEHVWPLLKRAVETAIQRWHEPDHGIWEVRGEAQHFTSSKLMCWVAADRGSRLARLHDEPDLADRWAKAAEKIHADICGHGVDSRGVFVQRYGSDALDASLLLMPLVRFLPADDPRIRATVLAIADELTQDGLVLRYRTEEIDEGLSGREGTFAIASFWLVSALTEIGEVERACLLCERLLSLANALGLYAEELDPNTSRHVGNFPQAFTHLALINAVLHVMREAGRVAPGLESDPPVPTLSSSDDWFQKPGRHHQGSSRREDLGSKEGRS
jgi:GH15 family glucan-1,4-alpha-glucosidase